MFVPCLIVEWSELPFKAVAEKYLSNDVSTILLTNQKIFTVVTPKNPKNHQLYATATTKKIAFTTKCLRT